jgi:sulfhydrogenase subunit beta (sulfur reductase)
MIEKILSKNEWNEWLKTLGGRYEVFAPVRLGDIANFAPLTEGTLPDFSVQNTRLSPKGLVHPPSEKMFQFSTDPGDPEAHILKEVPKEDRDRLLVGVRPCDARAFQLVRLNFITTQYVDPWWRRGYERLTLVGAACLAPCSTCFCTSVGGGPFDGTGLDVLTIEMGDRLLLRSVTEKGEKLLAGAPGPKAGSEEQREAQRLQAEAEGAMTEKVPTDRLKDQPLLDLFNAPFWDEIQFACINCGTCTYLCPTCWCFDIQDEVHGKEGVRLRNWDSCMYPLFTLHGSGHNPRGEKVQRVRQRFMHKLKYYVDKYGNGVACVGCGRCVLFCPVNIDIRRVARLMNDYQAK